MQFPLLLKAGSYSLALGSMLIALAGAVQQSAPKPDGYSTGVVGYVNVLVTNGYNFLANPLSFDYENSPSGNCISNVLRSAPEGTKVYLYDVTNQVFTPPSAYSVAASNWTINYFLPVGQGFVLQSPTNYTQTFVGNVLQGYLTNFLAGSNKFSLLGSMVPITGSLSNLFFPGADGHNAFLFDAFKQHYSDAFSFFANLGWFDPYRLAGTNGPIIEIAHSFFVQSPGPDTNWIWYFTVQNAAVRASPADANIQSLTLSTSAATLKIRNAQRAAYNVQFSSDGLTWSTVGMKQTAAIWSAPRPGGVRGYYRLTKP